MQLNKIKLAGFKSFVDPTTVHLPSNLVAVVGPNGCGKSNIIDAICWVMGESSAKQLRGELLTDVIFNGSGNRKPVGQASVELVFDNQDGSLGGEYSNYAEISIRRVITRNADSMYYLNGTRCRRKDVIDIFLGTGLGPRSYSIIGQNMISRLIEAKPEEMRVYLEEAAGISRYKERRRETENRIHHTKENLLRLNDLRAELEKQLSTLKRQASTAERFKAMKEDERIIRGQWFAIQWKQFDTRLIQYSLQIQQQETGMEARLAEMSSLDRTLELKREEQHITTETFQEVQRRYYIAGNEITRMEQEIRHHQERQNQWKSDLSTVDREWKEVFEQLEEIEEQLNEIAGDIAQLEPELIEATETAALAMTDLQAAEEATQVWQINWDEFNNFASKTTQTAQVEQTRIQHLEQKLESLQKRKEKLTEDQKQFNPSDIERNLSELSEQTQEATLIAENHDEHLSEVREDFVSMQAKQKQMTTQLDQVRSELQQMRGQAASLSALQQTALGQRNSKLTDWLTDHKLDQKPRLAQHIQVSSGWELAVEKVLGTYLQAICVDRLADIAPTAGELKNTDLCLFASETTAPTSYASKDTLLLSKVQSKWPLDSMLSGIYIADSLSDALTLSRTLAPHESVITADGIWLSANWMRLVRADDPAAGIFQRETELKALEKQIETYAEKQALLEEDLAQTNEAMQQNELEREQLQRTVNVAHAQASELQAREKMQKERLQELLSRADQTRKELEESTLQFENTQDELTIARDAWQIAMANLEQHAEKREALVQQREQSRATLQTCRDRLNQAKDFASQLQIRLQTSRGEQGSLKQSTLRMQTQLSSLAKRKTHLQSELDAAAPVQELEDNLADALENRLGMDEELKAARSQMESVEHTLRESEAKRQTIEREMNKYRDVLETLRLDSQSFKVKTEGLVEQIKEMNADLQEILQTVPPEASAEEWQAQLEQISQRITRLGPINLVAIDEYTTCSERKEYLDSQYNDLQDGLNTLESAIAKMDKETRAKFKETFDKVNDRFQELFPAIFGGGRAYLELTGENLLDAGITVMACPPGKRNSTIHLLSGGEKALTAISLVFSIFHLNPAPFCLLDEVDAPLDDANIGRFCQLVKSMSDKTQFIFISHNKLAIEMGKHLIGVTMHEPGVSRLVSVNLEEAIHLAGA